MSFNKKNKSTIFVFSSIVFSSIALAVIYLIHKHFGITSINAIIFHLLAPLQGSIHVITHFATVLLITTAISCGLAYLILAIKKISINIKIIFSLIYLLSTFVAIFYKLDVYSYLSHTHTPTTFIQDNYSIPQVNDVVFKDKKRNCIVIMLESIDTGFTKDSFSESLIPQLENLQRNNVHFPQLSQTAGTGWTIAAITAMTFGIPLKLPIHGNSYSGKVFKSFLPKTQNILQILKENGYSFNAILGSDVVFSGQKNLFDTHFSGANLYDLSYINQQNLATDKSEWGITDKNLYSIAKKLIKEKVNTKQPFFVFLETIDTHNIIKEFEVYTKYYNDQRDTIRNADAMAVEFVKWLTKQDFYENTTIILLADHRLMNTHLGEFKLKGNRYLYNVIINSPFNMEDRFLKRKITMLDMAPTILESMGATIKNKRFGLGVSAFSNQKTLLEKHGAGVLHRELSNKSDFYNTFFGF